MAPSDSVQSLDEVVRAGRVKRKNEALLNQAIARNRRANGTSRVTKKGTQSPSLSSRLSAKGSPGIPPSRPRANPFSHPHPPTRPSSGAAQHARANKIAAAINSNTQVNLTTPSRPERRPDGPGLSIKGTAGPFVVQASNFAPGTTAADIEAAMQAVAVDTLGNSGLVTCRILANNPTVMAEMVCTERYIADKIVNTYNNEKADGRILHVFLKHEDLSTPLARKQSAVSPTGAHSQAPTAPKDLFDNQVRRTEDIDMTTDEVDISSKEVSNRDRRNHEQRQPDPEIQDGRFGFSDGEIRDEGRTAARPRESAPAQNEAEQRMDDRINSQGRDGERDRGYDDRYSDRRDDRGSYRRDSRYDSYYNRDERSSHYGNGVGGRGQRGGDRYGRMYSDDVMRAPARGGRGYGPPRGGYR